jgi:phage host-nuclease inhibitor protein Gam
MRILIGFIVLLYSCTAVVSQQPSEEQLKEEEYQALLRQAKQTQQENIAVMKAADEKTTKIITKTAQTIVSLKEEVKDLKQELNETKKSIDSINVLGGTSFHIGTISNSHQDR